MMLASFTPPVRVPTFEPEVARAQIARHGRQPRTTAITRVCRWGVTVHAPGRDADHLRLALAALDLMPEILIAEMRTMRIDHEEGALEVTSDASNVGVLLIARELRDAFLRLCGGAPALRIQGIGNAAVSVERIEP